MNRQSISKDTDCESIHAAIVELQNLQAHFDTGSPEDVRTRIQAFASALKKAGIIKEKQKSGKVLLVDIVRLLPMQEFGPYLAEAELFDMYVSEYNDPDEVSMKDSKELLDNLGPKLVADLETMEKECREMKSSSQAAPPKP